MRIFNHLTKNEFTGSTMKNQYPIIVFLFLTLIGCQEDKINPDLFGSLNGEVLFEEDNLPAEGVTISTSPSSSSLLTGPDGSFEFETIKIGTFTVRAELNGYLTATESVTILEDQTSSVVLKLRPITENNQPPIAASSPSPADGTVNLPLSFDLSWEAGDPDEDDLSYDVYLFDADMQNETLVGEGLTDPNVLVEDLRYGSAYFWQVVVNDGQADPVYGEVWQFTTRPFPNHQFVFSKIQNSVFEIYSGDSVNEFYHLTTGGSNYRPKFSPFGNRIAFINANFPEKRLFTMKRDGSELTLVETFFPIQSQHELEMSFTWSPDGTALMYMRGNRMYKINIDGTGLELFYELSNEEFIEVDWTGQGNLVAARTIGDMPYDSRILLFKEDGTFLQEIVPDLPGGIGGPAFSIDGNSILYTWDTLGFESADGKQLESHIFLKNLNTGLETDLSLEKPFGFNDFDPRFSPNGALVVFTQTSNTSNSQRDIYIMDIQGQGRQKLFENSEMPDWWD